MAKNDQGPGCCAVLIGLALIAGVFGSCNQQSSDTGTGQTYVESEPEAPESEESEPQTEEELAPEVALATLQQGYQAESGDSLVEKFAARLDSLEAKTTASRMEISDVTVYTWERLGKQEDLLTTITALDGSIPKEVGAKTMRIKEVAAMYITLRKKGLR